MSLLEMKQITKRFPGVIANDQVDLSVQKGDVHALLGENGAGKTTLMNILYGFYQPDEGEIYLQGNRVQIKSPIDAMNLGIGMIHQHFMLVSAFTVLENIILGTQSDDSLLDLRHEREKVIELSNRYGVAIDLDAKIWQLSLGERQRVEIVKAVYRRASLLILDEPTAVLTPMETRELFKTLRSMIDEGHTILFISHKLNEIFQIADRITVLRDGRAISTFNKSDTNKKELAEMMVGRDVTFEYSRKEVEDSEIILSVRDLAALNDKNMKAIENVSFELRKGEILGVAGVSGNGQRELAEVISGLRKATAGHVHLKDEDITNKNRRHILHSGVGFIPEDRTDTGLIMDFSVSENAILEDHDNKPFSRNYVLDGNEIRSFTERLISEYNIKAASISYSTKLLSGGNLQKLLLARELTRKPQVLIAAQPTRGLDVAATEYVHKTLLEEREYGTAILLISEDLEEILALSDRIMVIYEGKIMGVLVNKNVDLGEIGMMMTGTVYEAKA